MYYGDVIHQRYFQVYIYAYTPVHRLVYEAYTPIYQACYYT